MSDEAPGDLLHAAEAAFAAGDMAHAEAMLLSAVRAGAEGRLLAEIKNDLGVVADAQGRLAEAETAFLEALAVDPGYVDAIHNLAELYERSGETARAQDVRLRAENAGDRTGSGRRVLIVCDLFYPAVGGTEVLVESLGVALQRLGMTVEIAATAIPERQVRSHRGLVIHEIEDDRGKGLTEVVRRGRYDAMLVFSNPTVWPMVVGLQLPEPRPRMIPVPCVNAEDYDQLHSVTGLLDKYAELIKAADVVGVSSKASYDRRLADELRMDAVYVPNAVDRFEPTPGFRERHRLRSDRSLLLVVGNFRSVKNQCGLVRALSGQAGDWQLVFAGSPSRWEPEVAVDLEKLAASDQRMRIVGSLAREEVASAMAEADLLLLPSLAEATPLVLLEAMSHGLPWLATPTCGAAHEYCGGVITPLEQFGEVISRLLSDRSAREQLGEAGRAQWESCFTWEVVAERYGRLLAGHPLDELEHPEPAVTTTAVVRDRFRVGQLPTVTCVMAAHNHERYVRQAIESVLAQTYLPELLDLVVVDDGSTDRTAAVVEQLAIENPGRITLIRRENAGLAAATATGIDEARGDYLTLCDSDDMWLPDKLKWEIEVFRAQPSVSVVYGDMQVVDNDGNVVNRSLVQKLGLQVRRGNVLDDLARSNFTVGGTLMWRRGSVPLPPDESPYADYWIALHAAASGDVWGLPVPLSEYRLHDSNMGLNVAGTDRHVAELRREMAFRRLLLGAELASALRTDTVVELALSFEAKAREIVMAAQRVLVETAAVTDAQRAAASELLDEIGEVDSWDGTDRELRVCARAVALDPYSERARSLLLDGVHHINADAAMPIALV